MKFLSDIRRAVSALAHNQERLYILFCVVLMVTNCCLLITERMNIYARFAYLLIPLAAQMLLLAATKKPGIFFLILFPKIILDAFQLVLLKLYGNSVIAVDMFLNLVTTSATEAGELLGSIAPVIIFMLIIYIPSICFAVVSVRNGMAIKKRFRKRALITGSALLSLGIAFLAAAKCHPDGFRVKYDLYPNNVIYNLDFAIKKWHRINDYAATSRDFTFEAARCDSLRGNGREIYVLAIGETARADNGVFTDNGAIEHNRTHADQSTAFDGAAMQNGGVSDGDVVFNDAGKTFFRMNDRIVLYVAADSHGDGLQVSAQYGPRPDTAVVFEFHTTDHLRGFCGPGGKRYPRDVVFEGESSHNRTTAKSQKVAWVWDCTDT